MDGNLNVIKMNNSIQAEIDEQNKFIEVLNEK